MNQNIDKIISGLIKFQPDSRNYRIYMNRIKKKYKEFLWYKKTRTPDKSLEVYKYLKEGNEISTDIKYITDSLKK